MRYLRRFSPTAAYRDLRQFLAYRQKHELWFAGLAVVLTMLIVSAFVHEPGVAPPAARRSLLYIESWPVSRTDREIIEQQKRDMVVRQQREAEIRAARLERRRQMKALDDKLEAWGF